jgi:collagenase-like PrtC family protease
MELSIATIFDNTLIDRVKGTSVKNLFGKLTQDFVGGGLEPFKLDTVTREQVENHIGYAHEHGITYNYTLNSPCLANAEFSENGRMELRQLLDWLVSAEVDSVTVSIPLLLRIIKKEYPEIQVKVSSSVCVDSVIKARRWEEMGADCIVLDPMVVNRDFEMLNAIRKAVGIDLELIINNNCLWHCPFLTYHQSCMGHTSRGDGNSSSYDYCYLSGCSLRRVTDPAILLMTDWIRPEDLSHYEELGYTQFKIIDRATPMEFMVERVRAYENRSFEGNLLRIMQHFGYRDIFNPEEIMKHIYIDNQALDGFIEHFKKHHCSIMDCGRTCRHCHRYAEKAVRIAPEFQAEYKKRHTEVMKEIETCYRVL